MYIVFKEKAPCYKPSRPEKKKREIITCYSHADSSPKVLVPTWVKFGRTPLRVLNKRPALTKYLRVPFSRNWCPWREVGCCFGWGFCFGLEMRLGQVVGPKLWWNRPNYAISVLIQPDNWPTVGVKPLSKAWPPPFIFGGIFALKLFCVLSQIRQFYFGCGSGDLETEGQESTKSEQNPFLGV